MCLIAASLLRYLAIASISCFPISMAHAQPPSPAEYHSTPSSQVVDESLYTGDALEGTFLQLNISYRNWPQEQWHAELTKLHQLGLKSLVLQWSMYDDVNFINDGNGGPSTIERILTAADEVGLDCYVGLSLSSSWWKQEITAEYLENEKTRSINVANDLHPRVNKHQSFRGWYIPNELSELYYDEEKTEAIIEFYTEVSDHLRNLEPTKLILASAYTNPQETHLVYFVQAWSDLIDRLGIDVLIFQDSAGIARNGSWEDILPYIEAITVLDEEFSGDVWLLAELFSQTSGPPLDESSFKAEPASIDRVRQQLDELGSFQKKLIAFSYFDYMRPEAGEAAGALLEGYRQLLNRHR